MVDVLILNYNDWKTTHELIESIKAYSSISHILIVDNCSTDDSLLQLSKDADEKVEIIQTTHNGGYGAGNNFGIKYLYEKYETEYILLANPDVKFTEESVIAMTDFLSRKNTYVAVAPFMCNSKGERQSNTGWMIPSKKEYILSMSMLYSIIHKPGAIPWSNLNKIVDVDAISGSLYMMNTKLMIENGMYDEDIFLYCEETVLGFKLKLAGYRSAIITSLDYIHNHSVSISKTYKSEVSKRKLLLKSRHCVLARYYNANIFERALAYTLGAISLLECIIICNIKRE